MNGLTPDTRRTLGRWLKGLVALYALNFALTFHNVWPTPFITTRHELSVEIAALLVLLYLVARVAGTVPRRLLGVAAIVLTVLTVGRYAEVTAPALYGRRINLYWDAQHVPAVTAMLVESAPVWLVALGIGCIAALLAVVYVGLRWCLAALRAPLLSRGGHALGSLGGLLVVAYVLEYTALPVRVWQHYSLPVTTTYWRQAQFIHAAASAAKSDALPAPVPMAGANLERVAGADVLVVFVESYGATAYDVPEVAARVAPSRERFAAAVAETGRIAASTFVESPTFGGGSWLAHMSFFTGREVRDQGVYNLMLTQRRDTLASRFAAAGYRIVGLMPGLKSAWPEGRFYSLDTVYGERALEYAGPEFGWWRIPDQYALAKLAAVELDVEARAPVFLFFPTISTHMPFKPTPPYQPDWQRLLTDRPYEPDVIERALTALPEWTHLRPAYADTLVYTFDYLASFLRERAADDFVLVLLGDHQPVASVSGLDARADVPVHIVSNRHDIVTALVAAGFDSGMNPGDDVLGGMHRLAPLLLDAFSEPALPQSRSH